MEKEPTITYMGEPYVEDKPKPVKKIVRKQNGTFARRFFRNVQHYTRKTVFVVAVASILLPTLSIIVQCYGTPILKTLSDFSTVVYADDGINVPQLDSPVLDRIGDCESGNGKSGSRSQYDKNGQVIMHPNKDGSIDIGMYQINKYHWAAKAKVLNLDLTKEEDNRKMAGWIYLNVGTGPWASSSKCWNK